MTGKEIETEAASFDAAGFAAHTLSSRRALAAVLDHTLLKPEATRAQVVKLAEEAAEHGFACAMVNPAWASLAHHVLRGSGVPVGVVVGFPLGAGLTSVKVAEAATLLALGAAELDIVMNVGWLKSGEDAAVERDIRALAFVVHEGGGLLKVILETCLLTEEEKHRAARLAIAAGADFIKTSTGFSSGGATAADIRLIRGIAGSHTGVKASGGIRTLTDAKVMLEAGASRIGASASVTIVEQLGGGVSGRTDGSGY